MNAIMVKGIVCWVLMIVFLTMASTANDVVNNQLFGSLGVIMGMLALKSMSPSKEVTNE